MGNTEGHDIKPVRDDVRKELNLSRKITYKQFSKHISGQPSEACLLELPWSVRDAVSLYERLDASFNCLIDLPVELPLRLPHLNYINLAYNDLPSLPESIGLFFHLETLLLNNNNLASLPTSLASLTKLEKLDLSHNSLRELPDNLGRLPGLRRLNVCANKLRKLPVSLGSCDTLTLILATGNRLVAPPQSVCNEGSRATIAWMRKNVPTPAEEAQPKSGGGNAFPRVRGSQLNSAVPNAHSAEAAYKQAQRNTTNTSSKLKTPLLPPLGATALDPYDLRDKIVGLIYGAAIGDAIGLATQGMTPDECVFHYNSATLTFDDVIRDELRVRWRLGDWSDCFDQVVLVLDSLTHWGGVVDELEFAQRLKSWSQSGFTDLGDTESFLTSTTIQKVLESADFLRDPHQAALEASESSLQGGTVHIKLGDQGAVCRAVLLGIPQFHSLEEVVDNSVRICRATHADRRCVAVAVMASAIVALLLQGAHRMDVESECEALLERARSLAVQHLVEQKHLDLFMATTSSRDFRSCAVDEGDPFEPLARALPLLRARRTFRQSITELAMIGGNSCVSACLTGALIGCSYGFSNLPPDWVHKLRKKQTDWLNVKINVLLDMMAIP